MNWLQHANKQLNAEMSAAPFTVCAICWLFVITLFISCSADYSASKSKDLEQRVKILETKILNK